MWIAIIQLLFFLADHVVKCEELKRITMLIVSLQKNGRVSAQKSEMTKQGDEMAAVQINKKIKRSAWGRG